MLFPQIVTHLNARQCLDKVLGGIKPGRACTNYRHFGSSNTWAGCSGWRSRRKHQRLDQEQASWWKSCCRPHTGVQLACPGKGLATRVPLVFLKRSMVQAHYLNFTTFECTISMYITRYVLYTLTSNLQSKHSATVQFDPTKMMCIARSIEQKQTDRIHNWGTGLKSDDT